MNNLKGKNMKIVTYYILLIIFSIFLVIFLQGINKLSLKVPFIYTGGDEVQFYLNSKMIKDTGWIFSTSRLGAPFGATSYDFIAHMFSNFNNLLLKFLIFCTGDSIIGLNLYFISIFPLTAVISFYVMQELKITYFISFCMSLLYSFTPYILMRGIGHLVLSSAYFVPLSILLCLWLYYSDDSYLIFNKKFFSEKKNWLTVVFCILIANNGWGYYQFFTCFFVFITIICKRMNNGTKYDILKGFKILFLILFFFTINLIPPFLYFLKNGYNPEAVIRGGFESEFYGLKITLLYLPIISKIAAIKNIIYNYTTTAPFINENRSEYLGILGCIGFSILLLKIFSNKLFKYEKNIIELLAKLNISAILLGTMGGFGSIFAYAVSTKLRGYNRISIYIAYMSILTIAIIFNELLKKNKHVLLVIISIISVIAFIEQTHGIKSVGDKDYLNYNFYSDKKFVERIEKSLPENSMIFQLPYHPYPESGPVNNMHDYHLMAGYLNSNALRWSYGGIKGRKEDLWNRNVSSLNVNDMIKILSIAGFSGIYIDKRAYKDTELNNLREKIKNVLEETPIESENGNLLYYSMLEYNKRNSFSALEKEKILNNIISFSKGCYIEEGNRDTNEYWRCLSKESEIIIDNIYPDEQEYTFEIYLNTFNSSPSTVDILLNGIKVNSYLVNNEKKEIKEKLHLKSGKNIITIKTDAKKIDAPGDPRELYLKMSNYKLFDLDGKILSLLLP